MKSSRLFVFGVSALAGATLLAGCGGSSGGGDGTDVTSASFSVVDAPVDNMESVWVTFDKIELVPSDGGEKVVFELESPKTIDLLDHQGSNDEMVFDGVEADPGDYDRILIYLIDGTNDTEGTDGSYVVVDEGGAQFPLYVPGNHNRGNSPRNPLKLQKGFTLAAGNRTDFVIDFELRKALTDPQNANYYFLRPALKLINKLETGTITGTVAPELVGQTKCSDSTGETGNAVYLYDGAGASPGDVYVDENGDSLRDSEATEDDPFVIADVTYDGDAGVYSYEFGWVEARETPYTVAFTCQAGNDDPNVDNPVEEDPEAQEPVPPVSFDEQHDVTVSAGETTEQDFTGGTTAQ